MQRNFRYLRISHNVYNKMVKLNEKFVKFKLLYKEKEYAIIVTRRAAEQRSQRLLFGSVCFTG